jgi:hypothetical protein
VASAPANAPAPTSRSRAVPAGVAMALRRRTATSLRCLGSRIASRVRRTEISTTRPSRR